MAEDSLLPRNTRVNIFEIEKRRKEDKPMKKFFAILLSAMLMLSLAVPAMAATDNSITITASEGHTYEVYQIFTGDLSSSGVLSNIVWGDGVSSDGQNNLGDAADIAAGLTDVNIKDFQANIDQYLTDAKIMEANGGTYTLDNLAAGYYLIKDQAGTQDDVGEAYTAYIIQVVGEVNMTPKASVPSVDKSVTEQGKNADDFEIGDTVTFILKATLGAELNEYKTYKLVFHDTMSDGLTFKEYVSATLGTKDVKSSFTKDQNGQNLTFTCDDIIVQNAESGDVITITYTAILNDRAEVGLPGNSNTVKLEYSNDPNWDGKEGNEPTNETPEDKVLVFTYELDVTKIDGKNEATKLSGAEFVLLSNEKNQVATFANGTLSGWETVPVDGKTWPDNSILTSGLDGKFSIVGLDADTYYLKETKAPEGYNLLAKDIKIVIDATLNTAEDAANLTALTIKVDDDQPATGDPDTGIVTTQVENNAGSTLPETGGIGTTIFYIVGGLMVVGAVVLLVTKKRMSAEG